MASTESEGNESEGKAFARGVERMTERYPERILKAIIRFVPKEIFSLTPGDTDTRVD
jgi:hypothetical protein